MQLITIEQNRIGAETINSVNSRDLYLSLEIKQEYANWIKRQIESLGLEENKDYLTIDKKVNRNISKDYIITIDTAKHIAMASRTSKGKEVREYFLQVEKQLLIAKEQSYISKREFDSFLEKLSEKSIEADSFKSKYYEMMEMTNKLLVEKIEKIEQTVLSAPIGFVPLKGSKLNEDEKANIRELYRKGYPVTQICSITHRSENAVSGALKGLK